MRTTPSRGVSLVEVMVSMVILLVGMLGLLQFQIVGLTSNQGARAHTTASQLARELGAALEKLPQGDGLVAPMGTVGADAPDLFGALLDGSSVPASGFRDMSTTGASELRGVTADDALERDPADAGRPMYQRRWTVWGRNDGGGVDPAVSIIAVSVIYRERTLPRPREVVLYVSRPNPAAVMANIAAFE
jgi:type IV pilus assembly protein PilV